MQFEGQRKEGKGKGKSIFLRRLIYRFRKPSLSSITTSFELRLTLTGSNSSHGPRFKRHLMQAQGVKCKHKVLKTNDFAILVPGYAIVDLGVTKTLVGEMGKE